ncbi:sperm flagellar protein 1-like [Drosophila miranda]|uniref:sperm flagellar protein 1-like n=1 Tax=Drosophila miranda TaxID=7229 RepID=UPI0007E652D2|nr:sperm flagellar protein 1-like [Drosophila miranda]XP_017156955.1 sperm flagellar protein 1-like [Drosophila miranda]XP_017156961.1 sperm flagellar protein 1-like [Drosophila miranda]
MGTIRELTKRERFQLDLWLKSEGITLNWRSRRDTYSDVRPVAEILKKICPSIRLEFYPTVSSFSRRLQNWEVFSYRVLKKLGLRLKKSDLKQLAEGRTGAIDWVLLNVFSQEEVPPTMWSVCKGYGAWSS